MKKVVIFDFDYTLGDSSDGIIICVQYALEKLGHSPADRTAILKTIGLSLPDTYRALTGRTGEARRFAQLFKEKADKVMVKNTTLYPQVPDMLERMHRRGLKTAIVTTKYHIRIEQILAANGISHLVDAIIGADDVAQPKPDPEGILMLREQFHVPCSDMLYVGDSIVDAQASAAAGVEFIAVLTGTTPAEAFAEYPCTGILNTVSSLNL